MKKTITKVMAVFMSMVLVLLSTITAMAENPTEIDDYLNTTYAKAIEPYGSPKLDDEGRYIVPLSKSSVSLKTDTSSKLYKSVWTSNDDTVIKVSGTTYFSTKVTHPDFKDGAKDVTLTLSIYDKKDTTKLLGSRDYMLHVEPKLPTYSLTVTAKNTDDQIIDNAKVLVTDEYYNKQDASKLKGNTQYTLTVSAEGYARNVQKVTLSEDTNMDVVLEKGATVNFNVYQASGKKTDNAAIKVTSVDGTKEYSPVLDEYGYETSSYELPYGEYKYSATYQSASQTAEGTFTVNEGDTTSTVDITLKYTEYKVKFNVTPANAKITLKKNGSSGAYGDEILPDENGYYTVIFGQYRYTIEADGYDTKSATFNATDTSLKNNNYVITVRLTSPYDTLLNKADDYLFNQSGDGLMMTEYSGVHSDPDFGSYADVDSDYEDVNITDTLEKKINENVASDDKFTVKVNKVENMDGDVDNSVIYPNGTINYLGVYSGNYDEDFYGAVYDISLTLSYKGITKDSSVRVVVPFHSTSRQERLSYAANYAAAFSSIKGKNINSGNVISDLDLINVANTDDYGYYFICSSWQSSNPDVIDPETGKVTRPEKDTLVKLYVKTYYSQSQLDDGGFLFDGGPLGDNEAYQSLYVMVKGTKTQVPTTQPTTTEPDTSATEPSTAVTKPSTEISQPANSTTAKPSSTTVTVASTSATTQPSNLTSASTVKSSVSSTSTTAKSTASKPKKTSIKKLKKGKKSITILWEKSAGVKGYQIQLATDKKFKKNKKIVTIKKQKTTKKTVKKLKSKKKYFVRVRTYKTVNGKKVYSSWSKIKSVKTK